MLSETANKLPLPVHRLHGWLLVITAVVRHEQLLLRLNQSLATFLSANMCERERECTPAPGEKRDAMSVM